MSVHLQDSQEIEELIQLIDEEPSKIEYDDYIELDSDSSETDILLIPNERTSLTAQSPPIINNHMLLNSSNISASVEKPASDIFTDEKIIINVGGKSGRIERKYLSRLGLKVSDMIPIEIHNKIIPFHDEDPVHFSRMIAYLKNENAQRIISNFENYQNISEDLLDILSKYNLIDKKRTGRIILTRSQNALSIIPRCICLSFNNHSLVGESDEMTIQTITTTTTTLSQSEYFYRRLTQLDESNPKIDPRPINIEISNIDFEHFNDFIRLVRYGYSRCDTLAFTNTLNDLGVQYIIKPLITYPLVHNYLQENGGSIIQAMKGISSILSLSAFSGVAVRPAVTSNKCYGLLENIEYFPSSILNFRLWNDITSDNTAIKPTFFNSLELIIDLPFDDNEEENEWIEELDVFEMIEHLNIHEESSGRTIIEADQNLILFLITSKNLPPPSIQKCQMIYDKNIIKLIRFSLCIPLEEPLRLSTPLLLSVKVSNKKLPETMLNAYILAECQWAMAVVSHQDQLIKTNHHLCLPYNATNWKMYTLPVTKQNNITGYAYLSLENHQMIETIIIKPENAIIELIVVERKTGDIVSHHDTLQSRNAQFKSFGKRIDGFYFTVNSRENADTGIPGNTYDLNIITHAYCTEIRIYLKEKVWLVPN
jgi:hypothetical protein